MTAVRSELPRRVLGDKPEGERMVMRMGSGRLASVSVMMFDLSTSHQYGLTHTCHKYTQTNANTHVHTRRKGRRRKGDSKGGR